MRSSALVRFTGCLAASLLGVGVLVAGPASADDTPLPVVVDDAISLYPGQVSQLNVLANDSSPTGDDLALCRFPDADLGSGHLRPVEALDVSDVGTPGDVMVITSERARGTHVIDYYVCDHVHLVPAHLTVTIKPVSPVVVHKVAGKPGRLRVTNKNTAAIRFWFGDRRAANPDGKVRIAAGATRTVTVRRHTIVWIALIGGGGGKAALLSSPGLADRGVVHNIKLRPGQELPPPKTRSAASPRSWRTPLR